MRIRETSVVVVLFAVLVLGASVSAQTKPQPQQDKSSWGVGVYATPKWEYMSVMDRFIGSDHRLEGQEFRVGIVRGRIRGGDWGVSVVRGEVNSSSFRKERTGSSSRCQISTSIRNGNSSVCTTIVHDTEFYLSDVSLLGFEAYKYVPFVTVRDRVQIGVNLGGGAMWAKGSAQKHMIETRTVNDNDKIDVSQSRTVETIPFKDVLGFSTIPTGRIEAVLGIIATDHLKVKVSGGLNFPTQHRVAIGATYLF